MTAAVKGERLRTATDLVDRANFILMPCILLVLAAISAIALRITEVTCEVRVTDAKVLLPATSRQAFCENQDPSV